MTPPVLPARCPMCGCLVSSGVSLTNVQNTQVSGSVECHCGAIAKSFEGTVNVDDRHVDVIKATPANVEMLRRAGLLIEQLLEEGLEPEAIAERVAEVDPELAKRLPRTKKALATFAAGLLLTAGAPTATRAGEAVRDRIFGEKPQTAAPQFQPPEGSEGEITYRDGMKIRWAPGTRPVKPKP